MLLQRNGTFTGVWLKLSYILIASLFSDVVPVWSPPHKIKGINRLEYNTMSTSLNVCYNARPSNTTQNWYKNVSFRVLFVRIRMLFNKVKIVSAHYKIQLSTLTICTKVTNMNYFLLQCYKVIVRDGNVKGSGVKWPSYM